MSPLYSLALTGLHPPGWGDALHMNGTIILRHSRHFNFLAHIIVSHRVLIVDGIHLLRTRVYQNPLCTLLTHTGHRAFFVISARALGSAATVADPPGPGHRGTLACCRRT